MLKKPLAELIPALTSLKVKDYLQLDFSREIKRVAVEAEALPELTLEQEGRATREFTDTSEEERLANRDPRVAIVTAWTGLTSELDFAWRRLGFGNPTAQLRDLKSPRQKAGDLIDRHYIDEESYRIINSLTDLRNKIVADQVQANGADAVEYVRLAAKMRRRLSALNLA